ncbi:MAG: ribonuclease III [Candidatus Gastranaerophilales bacterium]|nr:ribonuclease III [Candidatus Gastranaerophilales bacterium]
MEESMSLLQGIRKVFACREKDIKSYSPLTFAYIGDAVYDLVIRSVVVERANRSNRDLHGMTTKYVKAPAQAAMIQALQAELTPEEALIYKRGCNAKPSSVAKNATAGEYRRATGYEALLGYLYLTDQTDRILELIRRGIELAEMEL